MIECTDECYYGRKKKPCKKRRRFKRFLIFAAILGIAATVFYGTNFAGYELVTDICAESAEKSALRSVNFAIGETLEDSIKYSELITVERDGSGNITLISANSFKINSLCREVAAKTEEILSAELKKGCKVPIFAFTGLKFLSGAGVEIDYKSIRIGAVNCGFYGNFSSVGINQTLHSLYLKVDCGIYVGFLYKSRTVDISSDILISESVLVGKVPEIYLNGRII